MQLGRVERRAIVRHALVSVRERPAHALELHACELVTARVLQRIAVGPFHLAHAREERPDAF
jgi:hypothetical protein